MSEQRRVRPRYIEVVRLNRNRGEHVLDECAPPLPALAFGELDAE
jgi:hypothetical protein